MKAYSILSALLIHLLDDAVLAKTIGIMSSKYMRKFSAIRLGKEESGAVLPSSASPQDSRWAAYFAYNLEYCNHLFEKADMEDRKDQLYVAKVSIAFL
jgi:hypothetical protein